MSGRSSSPEDQSQLPHEEAVGLLDALRDGELDDAEAARVEAHVASCDRCRAMEAVLGGGLKQAVRDGEGSRAPDLLPGVQRRLRLRSRGRFYGEEDPRRRPKLSAWPLVVASMALLLALGVSYVLLGQVAGTAPSPPAPRASVP